MAHTMKPKITILALAAALLLAPSLRAQQGDCDGNGIVAVGDVISLTSYLFAGGPPPINYARCDCDGSPGVDFGDLQQINGFLFFGGGVFPSPGTDLINAADASIMIEGQPDGTTVLRTRIYLNNTAPLLGGMTLPFTFAPDLAESDLDCSSILIDPFFAGTVTATISNPGKNFLLLAQTAVPATVGSQLLATANFILTPGGSGPGLPVCVEMTVTGRLYPLMVTRMSYSGTDYVRMRFPRLGPVAGDADCNQIVTISDAVYIINHVFGGGPAPCSLCF